MIGHNRNNIQKVEEKEMFDNIGGKIKIVAQFITWLGIVASIIGFFILSMNDDSVMLAFIVLIAGCIGSWLSSLTLYGFGQLIENTDNLVRRNTNATNQNIEKNQRNTITEDSKKETANHYVSQLHQLLVAAKLPEEKINEVLKLKEQKDIGVLSNSDCRKKVYKVIENLSIDKVLKILNSL